MLSSCRSSEPVISPLTCRLEPSRAGKRGGEIAEFSVAVCCLDLSFAKTVGVLSSGL